MFSRHYWIMNIGQYTLIALVIIILVLLLLPNKGKKSTAGSKMVICFVVLILLIKGAVQQTGKDESFDTLEQAVTYYCGEMAGIPVEGKSSALVPEKQGGEILFNIFQKENGKWMLSDASKLDEASLADQSVIGYVVSTIMEKDTGGVYVVFEDLTDEYITERKITDSESGKFASFWTELVEGVGDRIYYCYLEQLPGNYELRIDDYEV